MLEVLIATGVMLVIALSVLPLLLRSVANNTRGGEATQAASFAGAQLDALLQMPFDRGPMVLADTTAETVMVETQTLAADVSVPELMVEPPDARWQDGDVADTETMQWRRTTRVRQFGLTDLEPDPGTGLTSLDQPLPGGTAAQFVHLKEVEVRIESGREAGALGAGQDLTIRVLKAF